MYSCVFRYVDQKYLSLYEIYHNKRPLQLVQ